LITLLLQAEVVVALTAVAEVVVDTKQTLTRYCRAQTTQSQLAARVRVAAPAAARQATQEVSGVIQFLI